MNAYIIPPMMPEVVLWVCFAAEKRYCSQWHLWKIILFITYPQTVFLPIAAQLTNTVQKSHYPLSQALGSSVPVISRWLYDLEIEHF